MNCLFLAGQDVPEELKHAIPQDKFTKSLLYGIDKFAFSNIETSIIFLESVMLLMMGWLPYIWDQAITIVYKIGLVSNDTTDFKREVFVTTAFVFILALHDTIVSTPFSLYRTFVVEEKHGFNKTVSSFVVYLSVINNVCIIADDWVVFAGPSGVTSSDTYHRLPSSSSCHIRGPKRWALLLLLCMGISMWHDDDSYDNLSYPHRPAVQYIYPTKGRRVVRSNCRTSETRGFPSHKDISGGWIEALSPLECLLLRFLKGFLVFQLTFLFRLKFTCG